MNELKIATDTQGFQTSQDVINYVNKNAHSGVKETLLMLEKAIDKLQQLNFNISVPNIILMLKKMNYDFSEIALRQNKNYRAYIILRKNEPPKTTTSPTQFNQPFKVLANLTQPTAPQSLSEQFRQDIKNYMRPETWEKLEYLYKTIDDLNSKPHLGKYSLHDYVKHLKTNHNVYLATSMLSGNRLIKEAMRLRICENEKKPTTIQISSDTYENQHGRANTSPKKAEKKALIDLNINQPEKPQPKTAKNSLVDDITKVISMGLDENLTTEVIKSLVKKNKGA